MTHLDGLFSLRSPNDLLQKLESEFNRLQRADPGSTEAQYAAFDFFVTAEHLPDWVKHSSGGSLGELRCYPEGALVSHVASGAKHFHVEDSRHTEASDTTVVGLFDPAIFDPAIFDTELHLVIRLEDGATVDVMDVATSVLTHWRDELGPSAHA